MAYKIAVDAGPLTSGHKVRGVGAHTRELVHALKKLNDPKFEIECVDFDTANLTKYDIAHFQYFHPHQLSLPEKLPDTKTVITIHDLIRLIYPTRYPAGTVGTLNFFKQRRNVKKVDAIVTISETSKRDIVKLLGVKPEKVFVTYLAVKDMYKEMPKESLQEVKKKYKLPDKFVLYIGDINYNKNVASLVKACKELDAHLVIVGKHATEIESMGLNLPSIDGPRDWIRFLFDIPHPELAHFKELYDEINKFKKVIRTGFISEEDKIALLNLATVYCQPSFYEGFGLPVLEAMACGTPVLASRTEALEEVGGHAALYFNPYLQSSLVRKIKKLLTSRNLREELREKGLKQVQKFTWQKTARETLTVYEKILNKETSTAR